MEDENIGYWLKGVPYVISNNKRYYNIKNVAFFSDSNVAFSVKSVKNTNEDYCLFPFPVECKKIRDYFLINLNGQVGGQTYVNGNVHTTTKIHDPIKIKNFRVKIENKLLYLFPGSFTFDKYPHIKFNYMGKQYDTIRKIADVDYSKIRLINPNYESIAILNIIKKEYNFKSSKYGAAISQNLIQEFEKSVNLNKVKDEKFVCNPHLRFSILNKERPKIKKSFDLKDRLLLPSMPKMEFKDKKTLSTLEHWGQRKLLLTEIEFLTRNTSPNKDYVFIYAGAAPGKHIPLLSLMFPNIKVFELWDPTKFEIPENELSEKFILNNEIFTDDVAKSLKKKYKHERVLFLSDIRRTTMDEDIIEDMKWQSDWVKILRPRASLLKFRLPWDNKSTKYLKGSILIQPWAPINSTETRLEVLHKDDFEEIEYSHKTYEQQMFYFNDVIRKNGYFDVPFEGFDNSLFTPSKKNKREKHSMYDHCYDCSCELWLLHNYVKKFKNTISFDELTERLRCIEKRCLFAVFKLGDC